MSFGYRTVLDNMAGRAGQPAGADQAGTSKMSADILNNIHLLQNDLRILSNKVSIRLPFLKSTQTSWWISHIASNTRILCGSIRVLYLHLIHDKILTFLSIAEM